MLRELVTDEAYISLRDAFRKRRGTWEFHGEMERPKVVHVNAFQAGHKDNYFAQVTVMMKTRQSMDGGPVKECVNYAVFERHLESDAGEWRLCGQISPEASRAAGGNTGVPSDS